VFERFTRDARAVVISTRDICHGISADEVRPIHLLLALTQDGSGVRDVLAGHGITTDAVAVSLGVAAPAQPTALGEDDAAALRTLGIDLDAIRSAVERQFGEGALDALDAPTQDVRPDGVTAPDDEDDGRATRGRFGRGARIRFGRGSKKVLELALREAIRTGAREIRTEHIALGVLRIDDEALNLLMQTLGVDRQAVRADLEGLGRRTA
jgi:hypothetical protein